MKLVKRIFLSILIATLSFSLSSCGKEEEKLTLFPGIFTVKTITYNYYEIEYVTPLDIVEIKQTENEYYLTQYPYPSIGGELVEFELTKENFDNYFLKDEENFSWQNHENRTVDLRKSNNRAWYVETESSSSCYLLLQNNGTKYIVYINKNNKITTIYFIE